MNTKRAYCGLLDDFAARNNDPLAIGTLAKLNNHLISSVIIGDPLLINDGYLVMNPALRAAIVNPKKSPFQELVRSGFIRIVSRNGGDLPGLPKLMADQNIESALKLISDPAYEREIAPALEKWSASLNSGQSDWARPWPAHRTDAVFGKLGRRILDALIQRNGPDRDQVVRFSDALGDRVGSRNAWEKVAADLVRAQNLSSRTRAELMAAANESYQYAWGCGLLDKQNPVSVQTRTTRFLYDLDLPGEQVAAESRDHVRVFVPNQKVVAKKIRKHWEGLGHVAGPTSSTAEIKQKFRASVAAYYAGEPGAEKEVKRLSREYSAALADVFSTGEFARAGFDVVFAAVALGVPLLVAGPPGIAIAAGIAVAGIAANHTKPTSTLISRLGQTKRHKWIDNLRASDAKNTSSSFELNPTSAAEVMESIPLFTS
ncbi:hypothetical protein [Diaminobutyricibacter sp. McL0608]|uniref:hypothetical protein n=1 Tax=Leifsonia sp. McL0608 TaxID=3143537 RepID=UPI0031F304BE